MTRDSRNPNAWKNTEIEQDSEGYKAAQEASRLDQAREGRQRAEQKDLERFTAAFTKAGGSSADAAAAYRERLNEQAALAARTADETARLAQRGSTWTKL